MEFILVLFMNGWPVEVDRFKTNKECQEKLQLFNRAAAQSGSTYKVWCEQRQNVPKV